MSWTRPAGARLAAAIFATAFLSGLTASAADAATFCVNATAGQHCVGTAEPDLQTALNAARTAPNDTHRNKVVVGNPGPAPSGGYSYNTPNPATNPVDIVGAGQGTTTLTYSGTSSTTVLVVNGDGSSVSNLRIVIPAAYGGGGLVLIGGSAKGILITSPGPQTQSLLGVQLVEPSSATGPRRSFTQSRISFPNTGGTTAQTPVVAVGAVLVSDYAFKGQNTGAGGVLFVQPAAGYPKGATARRVRINSIPQTGTSAFGLQVSNTDVSADNVAINVGGGGGVGFGALVSGSSATSSAKLALNHVSVYGNGDLAPIASSYGVYVASSSGGTATASVRNSIVRNFFWGTSRTANGSGSVANIRYDYSDYDVIHRVDSNSSGGTGSITRGAGNIDTVDPLWLNPRVGDFRIAASSPVINKGAPGGLSPFESATDVLGRPRISNHRRDMGAVEFQFPPPKFKLLTGKFDASNGKVRLPAKCRQPAADSCRFKLTLTATFKRKIAGKTKTREVTLSFKGSAGGGKTKTLTAKLPAKALPFVQGRSKLRFAAGGTVTDNEAAVAKVGGKVTLKAATIP